MVENSDKGDEGFAGGIGLKYSVTLPDEISHHVISEEQLTILDGLSTDNENQLMWTVIGAAVGSISAAVSNLYQAYFEQAPLPLTPGALVEVIVFVTAIVLAVVCYKIVGWRTNPRSDMVKSIRERTRKRSTTAQLQIGQQGTEGYFERKD